MLRMATRTDAVILQLGTNDLTWAHVGGRGAVQGEVICAKRCGHLFAQNTKHMLARRDVTPRDIQNLPKN